MKHEPRIEYAVTLPDLNPGTVAEAVTDACRTMTAAAIRAHAFVGGPTVFLDGSRLSLRWSTDLPHTANDILFRHIRHCGQPGWERFHRIDQPASAPSKALPEFSEPVAAEVVTPPLPALAPGETLAEPVAFAEPETTGVDAEAVPPAGKPAPVTTDGAAIVANMPILADLRDGTEPVPGIVKLGPRGRLVTSEGLVRVRMDDGGMKMLAPDQLSAVKE
jgi:hypothetical protein